MKHWKDIKTDIKPEARSNHASFIYNGKLYVHGGVDVKEGLRFNMWSYDLVNSGGWKQVETQPVVHRKLGIIGPKALSHHTITVIGKYAYLYGGSYGTDSNSRMFRLDLTKMLWEVPP